MVDVVREQQRIQYRRLLIALGVSLFAHYLIVFGGWTGAAGARRAMVAPPPSPLEVRLESRTAEPVIELPLISIAYGAASVSSVPQTSRRQFVGQNYAALPAITPQVAMASAITPSNGPDDRFYLARELDHFPKPLQPWNLRDQDGVAGSVRLWVSIDQAGQVIDVMVVDVEPPGLFVQPLRDRVRAVRFDPARKDGRPVKSRVLLALSYGA